MEREKQLIEGSRLIIREIGAWFLMAIWMIFSHGTAQILWGQPLPTILVLTGILGCFVLVMGASSANSLRRGYKMKHGKRYLTGAGILILLILGIAILLPNMFSFLGSSLIPLVFAWNPISIRLEWQEELRELRGR